MAYRIASVIWLLVDGGYRPARLSTDCPKSEYVKRFVRGDIRNPTAPSSKCGKIIRKHGKDRPTHQCFRSLHLLGRRVLRQDGKMSVKKPEQGRNEQLIRSSRYLAAAASRDKPAFQSLFAGATATSGRGYRV